MAVCPAFLSWRVRTARIARWSSTKGALGCKGILFPSKCPQFGLPGASLLQRWYLYYFCRGPRGPFVGDRVLFGASFSFGGLILSPSVDVCVSVLSFICYPATCGPKGHGSRGGLFTYHPFFPGRRPTEPVIVGPPTPPVDVGSGPSLVPSSLASGRSWSPACILLHLRPSSFPPHPPPTSFHSVTRWLRTYGCLPISHASTTNLQVTKMATYHLQSQGLYKYSRRVGLFSFFLASILASHPICLIRVRRFPQGL